MFHLVQKFVVEIFFITQASGCAVVKNNFFDVIKSYTKNIFFVVFGPRDSVTVYTQVFLRLKHTFHVSLTFFGHCCSTPPSLPSFWTQVVLRQLLQPRPGRQVAVGNIHSSLTCLLPAEIYRTIMTISSGGR
jgi:hypothetical protein